MAGISRRSFLSSAPATPALASAGIGIGSPRGISQTQRNPLDGVGREDIKITDVKVTLLSSELPLAKQWMDGAMIVWKTDEILVQVFTDKGIVGIGSASQYGGPEAIKTLAEQTIRPLLAGKNPFDLDLLTCFWWPATFGPQVAWAAINNALWDIVGKAKGVPVYSLLAAGTKPNPHIRMYASGGHIVWYKRPEDVIDYAVSCKENGYFGFKLRIGTEWKHSNITVPKYIQYLRKLRDAVGPDFHLMQEINMRLPMDQVLELCPALDELKFLWLEEPVDRWRAGAVDDHLKLKQAMPSVKMAGGETMMTRFEFKEWVDRGAYDIVQPDCNTTGLTEGWQIARMAHLRGGLCCPHSWHGAVTLVANATLAASIPNLLLLEMNQTYNPLRDELFKEPLTVRKGYLDLPAKPGFGVELIGNFAQKYAYIPGRYAKRNPDLPK